MIRFVSWMFRNFTPYFVGIAVGVGFFFLLTRYAPQPGGVSKTPTAPPSSQVAKSVPTSESNLTRSVPPAPVPSVAQVPSTILVPATIQAEKVQAPATLQAPATSMAPVKVQAPVTSSAPVVVQAPATTMAPVKVQAPVTSSAPVVVQAPATTMAPVKVQAPVTSSAPVVVQAPPVISSIPVAVQAQPIVPAPTASVQTRTTPEVQSSTPAFGSPGSAPSVSHQVEPGLNAQFVPSTPTAPTSSSPQVAVAPSQPNVDWSPAGQWQRACLERLAWARRMVEEGVQRCPQSGYMRQNCLDYYRGLESRYQGVTCDPNRSTGSQSGW
ncbi:MAG: hypothetical protein H7839_04225 [Magnetococcus sp. YQC-5]